MKRHLLLVPNQSGHSIGYLFDECRLAQVRARSPLYATAVREFMQSLNPVTDSDAVVLQLPPRDWHALAKILQAELHFIPGIANIVINPVTMSAVS